jgi:uncharacterized protein YprB with RNaseH-like and TPR domain
MAYGRNSLTTMIASTCDPTYNGSMNDEWQARLKRLGVTKGGRHLRPAAHLTRAQDEMWSEASTSSADEDESQELEEGAPLQQLLPGLHSRPNQFGEYWVRDAVFPLSFQHGADLLADLLAHSPKAASFQAEPRLSVSSFRDFLFLDTETTGLAGANVIAFLVGVGYFDQDAFVVRQYFVPDLGEEAAVLLALSEVLQEKEGLITFNGRSFDIPLLDNRYMMNRLDELVVLTEMPHLDLLHPAQRLWRARLGSCALSALEQRLLAVQRSEADVPGWIIPRLYHEYLRNGDGRELARVFYHNEIDILSMATLAARLMRHFESPKPSDPPLDLLSLGRWHAHLNDAQNAERALRLALDGDLALPDYRRAITELATLLKRQQRREEAITLWQQLAVTSYEDVTAYVELSKHYEWHARDLVVAHRWAEQAVQMANALPESQARLLLPDLQHRLARLQRKLGEQ